MFFKRNIEQKFYKALKRSPVVLLTGARQTGKTTLMKKMLVEEGYSYVSFDDLRYLSAAQADPIGFLSNLEKPVILDEVQRVPELFLTIKNHVDQNRIPGMFALTGSANPLLISSLGDSLAGRMDIIELFPLSQGELINKKETFIKTLFEQSFSDLKIAKVISKEELCKKMVQGGYPGVQDFDKEDLDGWFSSYLATILQKDVKELANIEGLTQFPNLLSLLAARASSLLNIAEVSRASGIAVSTLNRYLTLLETLFIITFQRPWYTNLGKRLVKSPKVYLMDVGILLHLLKTDKERLLSDEQIFGKAFENFVVNELLKQASWSDVLVDVFHYRTQAGIEVDTVLESSAGKVVGIEIKSKETITQKDFKGLKSLQETVGKNFVCGVVLYTGSEKVPFGDNLWGIPVSALCA